jgi:Trypsin-like peptidase domain
VSAADGSDVAAIATTLQDVGGTHSQEAIPLKDFATAKDLYEGGTVVVLGYPGIVGDEYLIRAIVRAGIVAWRDLKDPFGKPFLIDANIYPGNSGGPVIKVPVGLSERGAAGLPSLSYLLGIVSQAPGQLQDISLRVPGVMLPLQLHQMIPVGGTGGIVPASKIAELLHSLVGR